MIARILTIIVLLVVAVPLVTFLVINRAPVDLSLDPFGTMQQFVFPVPLSLVMIVSLLAGVVLGCIFTWISQGSHRRDAWHRKFEIQKLEKEKREQADALRRLREERAERTHASQATQDADDRREGDRAIAGSPAVSSRMIASDSKAA